MPRGRPRRATRATIVDIPSSDEEMEVEEEDPIADVDEPEIAVEPEEEDEEDEESEDKEDELDEDDEQGSDVDVLSSPPTEAPTPGPSLPPRLRIKLKLPAQNSEASATATPTPDGSSRRRALAKGSDIESEDSDDDDDDSGSTSVATAPGRPLTARQAALRNVVDPLHVSLKPQNTRKKKQLTEWEMALKREETARKRRNLTEKKLEDEKAETINRLLKKQSRARGKRNALATAEDRSTAGGGQDGYGEDGGDDTGTQTPILPTMYRWISTTKAPTGDEEEPRMVLSFSVPVSVLPQPPAPAPEAMEVDTKPVPRSVPHCDVQGCDSLRKYRLVKDAQRGACGMEHLKALEAQMV